MGKYINATHTGITLPNKGKAIELVKAGAEMLIEPPKQWEDNIVCVVSNGFFDAAAYAYDQKEMDHFNDTSQDTRPRVWLKYAHAKDLAK